MNKAGRNNILEIEVVRQLKQAIVEACSNLKLSKKAENVRLEHPADPNHGDYATNVAMVLAGRLKKKPLNLAKLIAKELKSLNTKYYMLGAIEIASPGFINFQLSKEYFINQAKEILDEREFKKGLGKIGKNRTVVIDYSAPNIAKPFGIGHLRSTNIGQAVYNLYKILGWRTIGDNHLGDWGTQFGKLIVAIKKWWQKDLRDLTIAELEKLYVKFHHKTSKDSKLEDEARFWFKKLEDGDKEAKKIWQICTDVSLGEFRRVYKTLGVSIDYAYGESFYHFKGWMDKVLKDAQEKNLIEESQGAKIINVLGLEAPGMLIKSDGGTTYLLRDLATIKFRMERWQPDLIIYEVGSEHKFHFQQVFAIAEKLGYISASKLVHIPHGLLRWRHGKFSTRKGDTIHLGSIINEGLKRARGFVEHSQTGKDLSEKGKEKIAQAVGIGGIKFNDLKQEPEKDIIFDWDKILSLEGYSAPYLQYTCTRCLSILKKSKNTNHELRTTNYEHNSEELSLLRTFYQFPEVILASAENFSPHILCQYLFELSQKFNLFYQKHRILENSKTQIPNSKSQITNFRLFLTQVTANILKMGLEILGIEVLQKM